jgi:hypothetical protein
MLEMRAQMDKDYDPETLQRRVNDISNIEWTKVAKSLQKDGREMEGAIAGNHTAVMSKSSARLAMLQNLIGDGHDMEFWSCQGRTNKSELIFGQACEQIEKVCRSREEAKPLTLVPCLARKQKRLYL